MPGFLRKKEFEKVVRALWDKVKERFVEDVAFDDVTKILSKTKNGQTSDVIDLSTYAKKDEENHFTEDNLFKDVFLEAIDPYVENLGNYTSVAGGVKKTGRRDFTSHSNGNSGYVESLLIRVRSDKNAGDTTNVSVWEVTKAQDASNDVANQIVTNTQMSVIDYGNGVKCIEVPISKKYQDETYFIFQLSPSTDMAYYDATSSIEDFIYIDGDLPVDGNNISTYKNQQYVGICGLTGDPIKVRDMITKNCVEEWQDLEHVEQYQYINLMDYNKKVTGSYYGNASPDVWTQDTDWSTYFLDVTPGEQYTVIRKVDDSSRFIFTGTVGGTKIDAITANTVHQSNGFFIRSLTVPNRAGITKLAIQFRHNDNGIEDIMVVSEVHTTVSGFIPYADGSLIQIGTEVSHKFDNTGSNLGSTTVSSAIKELDEKIANVGGVVTFDEPTRTLKQTINGVQSDVVSGLVRKWEDLEYTTQSSIKNIFDKNTQVEEDKAYSFSNISANTNCRIVKIPCSAGDTFTIVKSATLDSKQVGVYNANDNHIQHLDANGQIVGGKAVYRFTIPNDLQGASYFVNSMYKDHTDINEVMVFKEDVANNNIPTKYVPFTDGATVLINSNEVALSFDGTGTSLSSSTIHSAIKELDGKIVNAGGGTVTSVNGVNPNPQDGNVTIDSTNINTTTSNQNVQQALDNKVETSRVGNNAGQIPQIDGTGKLVTSIMPDLAITSVQVVANEAEMMRLTNIQVGDVVVVENEDNKTYMCKDETQTDKDKKFVAINTGLSVVKVINNQRPDATGSLTLNGTQINVDGQLPGTTIKDELDKCVRTVNNQTPNNGNVTINALQINGTYNQKAGTVQAHLNTIKGNIDNNLNRITALESRLSSHVVGEFMVCYDKGDSFTTKDGAVFLHLNGRLITHSNYPDLAPALGIAGTVSAYHLPNINNITDRFDNGLKSAVRKHYVCAKI